MSLDVVEVPDTREWLETLGVEPEPVPGAPEAFQVRWSVEPGEALTLTVDPPGRSVTVRWERGDELLADLFREGATGVALHSDRTGTQVIVRFDTPGLRGELTVVLLPGIRLMDRSLLV